MTGIIIYVLVGVAMIEAATIAAIVAVIIRQLEWLRSVLVPWMKNNSDKLDAIKQKLGIPPL